MTAAEEAKIALTTPAPAATGGRATAPRRLMVTAQGHLRGHRLDERDVDLRRDVPALTSAAFFKVLVVALSLGLDVFAVCVGVGMRGAGRSD